MKYKNKRKLRRTTKCSKYAEEVLRKSIQSSKRQPGQCRKLSHEKLQDPPKNGFYLIMAFATPTDC
jgi:hypothetical protein